MALVYKKNNHAAKWTIIFFLSDDFGLRSSVIQKPFETKIKVLPLL